jgi:mannose-6-phosphate isomerase-like protein (cupin superfamily)
MEGAAMADYEAKRIDEMEAAFLGSFKRARAELGVESFGMQVIDLPPNFDRYPAHDHTHDNQEEVFVAMRGGGEIEVGEERFPLDADHLVRVGPTEQRKVFSGPDGIRVLILGGVPGQVYEAPEVSQLGAPDPMAQ